LTRYAAKSCRNSSQTALPSDIANLLNMKPTRPDITRVPENWRSQLFSQIASTAGSFRMKVRPSPM
jgi:hypothetical protein